MSSQKNTSAQPSLEDPLRSGVHSTGPGDDSKPSKSSLLSARLEPFDSFWQTPNDVEKGFGTFQQYYRYNYLPHLPANLQVRILVISCGPGYLVNVLQKQGYQNVLGIDSDAEKLKPALLRNLPCRVARAFEFLTEYPNEFDVIIPEQELNHLTTDETIEFLALCHRSLTSNGLLIVYGLNGANPLVGSENLSHNIDHFNTFTEYSLKQLLEIAKFRNIKVLPLKIYVFWRNPLNYVGWLVTSSLELFFRIIFKMYGKNVTILTKKIAASCHK